MPPKPSAVRQFSKVHRGLDDVGKLVERILKMKSWSDTFHHNLRKHQLSTKWGKCKMWFMYLDPNNNKIICLRHHKIPWETSKLLVLNLIILSSIIKWCKNLCLPTYVGCFSTLFLDHEALALLGSRVSNIFYRLYLTTKRRQ